MIVLGTSGVLALKDESHPAHRAVGNLVTGTDDDLLLSPFVLAECHYTLANRLHADAAREFLDEVARDAYTLIDFDSGDVAARCGVIDRYRDLEIGIADASLVVIAARHQTTRLLTFDQRHFPGGRPAVGSAGFYATADQLVTSG